MSGASGTKRRAPRHPPLSMLHLQGGGCGGCGLEIEALRADGRLDAVGLRLVDSPRHADLLLVSGTIGRTMLDAVLATWAAMPEPRWLVAAGACAMDGGPFQDGYAVSGGIGDRLPVSLVIPGCPPAPDAVLAGLCLLLDALRAPPAPSPPAPSPHAPSPPALSPTPLPAPPALPPAALPHPRAGGGGSGG